MKIFEKLKKARENRKGFTLVELIVVLVILAILAAMLLPALLGWIDEARNKQYVLEARSIYMAAQAIADEKYASGEDTLSLDDTKDQQKIEKLADVTLLGTFEVEVGGDGSEEDGSRHDAFTIVGLTVQFVSRDGKFVDAVLYDGEWTVSASDTAEGLLPG